MPHVGSSSAEDLASSDEIKVFEDEGEDEKRASADLTDLKSSLITEGDQEKSSQAFSAKSSSQQSTSHHQNGQRTESTSNFGKAFEPPLGYSPFGYPLPHSPYHSGTFGQMANKMAAAAAAVGASPHSASPLPFMMPNMEGFPQPPPAHMGISPVMRCETKANISMWMDIDLSGLSRNPLYNLPGHGQNFPSSSLLSDFTQLPWPNPAMYQLQQAAFRNQYPLPSVSSSAFSGFGRSPLMSHPSLSGHSPFSHPSFLPSATSNNASANSSLINSLANGSSKSASRSSLANGSLANLLVNGGSNGECRIKQEHSLQAAANGNRQMSANSPSANQQQDSSNNNNNPSMSNKNRSNMSEFSDSNGSSKLGKHSPGSRSQSSNGTDRETQNSKGGGGGHIKKPLNAFMIYMKEMRANVIAESTLKESAAINQILGKKWHSLSRAEQEKYYDKARKERELHMEMHPGWTAKDNYAINAKRKKKKRERNADGERGALKKCRAKYGLDQQNRWCKPCRRKKKCIRYLEELRARGGGGGGDHGDHGRHDNDDNLGSVGSVEAPTPESKSTNESDHDNLNSTDLSLSSPPTSDFHHHFMSSFNHFPGATSLNSAPGAHHLHLNGSGHLGSPSLFYPHPNSSSSLNSPIGSRMSSLLTPNSPLASLSNFSSSSLGAPATPNPSQVPPRNSPFSIDQLVGPARPNPTYPSNRSPSASIPSKLLSSTSHGKSNGSVTVSVITQLPTPPSSTDSTSATPTMLSVA